MHVRFERLGNFQEASFSRLISNFYHSWSYASLRQRCYPCTCRARLALQFAYMMLVGTFPFNGFLAGFLSSIGFFSLTGRHSLHERISQQGGGGRHKALHELTQMFFLHVQPPPTLVPLLLLCPFYIRLVLCCQRFATWSPSLADPQQNSHCPPLIAIHMHLSLLALCLPLRTKASHCLAPVLYLHLYPLS